MTFVKVGIIGAGSSGLFAAHELGSHISDNVEIYIFEAGPEIEKRTCPQRNEYECAQCDPCRIMSGIGGAGVWSSGILNLNKNIGGNLEDLCNKAGLNVDEVINKIDNIFLENGAPDKIFDPFENEKMLKDLKRKSAAADVKFIPIRQRLLGSKNTPKVIKSLQNDLEEEFNVKFYANTFIESFDKDRTIYLEDGTKMEFDILLIAPGRWGMIWCSNQCEKIGIKTYYKPLDIGVRVEVPSIIMEEICENVQRDPKFHIIVPTYKDFLRTFCVNHKGYVVKENYEENIVGVNGHQISLNGDSENSNFAFLIRQRLTSPLEDTTKYGRSISLQTSILGGYKPLVQTLGDLRSGHRSRESTIKRNPVTPSLKDVTPGDIAMAYPYRFITDLLEGLEILDKIIPGVNNDSTLLYAPEFKRSAKKVDVNEFLESNQVENIFFAGDGAGLSRGIIGAALTGIIAAQGIIKKIK
jgi:hypothetical protein